MSNHERRLHPRENFTIWRQHLCRTCLGVLGASTLALAACTQSTVADSHKQTAALVKPPALGPGTTLPDNLPNPAKSVMSDEELLQMQGRVHIGL